MTKALLQKEWRINRTIVVGALVVTLLPYVLALLNLWLNPDPYRVVTRHDWIDTTRQAGIASLIFLVAIASAFGGAAFASERRERTAEFVAMLPVSRWRIVFTKLVVAVICLAVLIVVDLLVVYICNEGTYGKVRRDTSGIWNIAGLTVSNTVAVFGISWTLSVFVRNPALAALSALVLVILLFVGGVSITARALQDLAGREELAIRIISTAMAVVGIIAAFSASLFYTRRVVP